LILKTEKNLWPSAQAENCRVALGLKRLDTPGLERLLCEHEVVGSNPDKGHW